MPSFTGDTAESELLRDEGGPVEMIVGGDDDDRRLFGIGSVIDQEGFRVCDVFRRC